MNATTAASDRDGDRLAAGTHMGVVDLRVSDLPGVLAFYTDGVGLVPLDEERGIVTLGLGTRPVLTLTHAPDLRLPSRRDAGLFHTAIVFDDAAGLAASLYSTLRRYSQLYQGSADHLVSRAFYFGDPEGNGVELYVDRPRSAWTWRATGVEMATLPLDPAEFLRENLRQDIAGGEAAPSGLLGTIGHVHLQVGDVPTARDFYVRTLGFDETASMGRSALFVSAGGYHHHMAMNTWNSAGAGPRGATLGLGQVDILVPEAAELEAVASRLREKGVRPDDDGRTLLVRDPWENLIRLSVG
ncbi:MAG TPA: VOC family protein [Actinomycetaceae bacterium]|nr:VOC family protein [Actinomycetaceae bacterium]